MRFHVALLAGLLALSGCGTTGSGVVAPGNLVDTPPATNGGKVATTIINAMNGGLVGGSVGAGLNDREKRIALEAEYHALEYTPSGQVVPWKGEGSTRFGEVTAGQPYRVGSQDCRQYTQTVNVDGQARTARGTACRNADGSWTPLT